MPNNNETSGERERVANDALFCVFHGNGGYETEQEEAKKHMVFGKRYRVISVEIHQSITMIGLEGVEHTWSSCMFGVGFEELRNIANNSVPFCDPYFLCEDCGKAIAEADLVTDGDGIRMHRKCALESCGISSQNA